MRFGPSFTKHSHRLRDASSLMGMLGFRRNSSMGASKESGSGPRRPFFESYRETYELSGKVDQQQDSRRIKFFLGLVKHDTKMDILDIGSAEGKLAVGLAERGHNVTAIDISATYLGKTIKLMNERGVRVETIQCDIETCAQPVAGRKFDAIYFMDVIEHVANPAAALSNIRSLLKDGGALFVATPNSNSPVRIMMNAFYGNRAPDNRRLGVLRNLHLHIYDFVTLNQVLNFSGFAVEKLIPTKIYVPVLSPFLRMHGGGHFGEFFAKLLPFFSHDLLVKCKKAEPLDVTAIMEEWQKFNRAEG